MKRILTFSIVMSLCLNMTAQEISVDKAMQNAQQFLQVHKVKKNVKTVTAPLKLAYTAKQNEKTCFYVFNHTDNGFIIAGGDEKAKDILAYSDEGTFDYEKLNPNFKWWLEGYKKQIKNAIDNPSTVVNSKKEVSRYASKSDVPILVPTRWDQEAPYYNLIKSTTGKAYLTGCVATAMSQVMKTHEWPVSGTGSKSYYDTESKRNYSTNFGEHTYDWANMLNTYGYSSSSYTKAQGDAVAQLMYDAGVSVEMGYSEDGSGAMTEDCAYAFVNFFGYDKGVKHAYRDYYTDTEWADILYEELSNGRPVMYGGVADEGGHSFICDGYLASTDKYHFNWGWSGSGDCYCSLSAVKGGGYTWEYYQDLVYGIQKPKESSKAEPNIILYEECDMSITETQNGDYSIFTCKAGTYKYDGHTYTGIFLNDAWKAFDVLFTMKYVNTETGEVYYTKNSDDSQNKTSFISIYPIMSNTQEITNITVKNVTIPKLPAGTYRIYLAYKDYAEKDNNDESLWKVVRSYTNKKNYAEVTIESTMETPEAKEATDITESAFTANWDKTADATFYNIELTTKEKGSSEEVELINENFNKFTEEGSIDISGKLDSYMTVSGWTGTKIYNSTKRAKLGSSNTAGNLTSPTLNAVGDVKVTIGFERYGIDATTATVKIGDKTETISVDDGTHEFTATVNGNFNVSIFASGSKQRMYINNVRVTANEGKSTKQVIEGIEGNSYTFTNLSNECDYSYRVRGGNGDELSKWSNSIEVELADGPTPQMDTCATPQITLEKGVLSFVSETVGAKYHYTLTDSDVKTTTTECDGTVNLAVIYEIEVYASAEGYHNSEKATATICWLDDEPQPRPTEVINMKTTPVIIQNNGSYISVRGIKDNVDVSLYTTDGIQQTKATSRNGEAILHHTMKKGSVMIIHIGDKSVKVRI